MPLTFGGDSSLKKKQPNKSSRNVGCDHAPNLAKERIFVCVNVLFINIKCSEVCESLFH